MWAATGRDGGLAGSWDGGGSGGDGRAGWVVQGSAPRGAGERCPLGAAFIDPKQG